MAKLYRTETTLQDILNMKVGDKLKLSGSDLPDYTEEDAGKALVVNQSGSGLKWGSELPAYTSADVGKVLTVGEDEEHSTTVTIVPEQTVSVTSDDAALSDVDGDGFTIGETATLKVNDNSYDVTIMQLGPSAIGAQYTGDDFEYGIIGGSGIYIFSATDPDTSENIPGTYTVSLTKSVPAVAPAWKTAVTEIEISDVFSSPSPVGWSLEELYNFVLKGERPILKASVSDGYRYFYLTNFNSAQCVWGSLFDDGSGANIAVLFLSPGKGGIYRFEYHNLATALALT